MTGLDLVAAEAVCRCGPVLRSKVRGIAPIHGTGSVHGHPGARSAVPATSSRPAWSSLAAPSRGISERTPPRSAPGGDDCRDYGTVPGTYNNIWLGLVFFNPAKLRVVVYFRLLEPPPRLVQDISASACLWLAGSTPYLRAAVALVDGRAGGFVSAMHAASERRHRRIVARRFRLSGSRFWWTRRRAHIAWKSLRLYPQFPQSGFLAGFPNPCFSTDPAVPNTCSELLVLIT